MADLVEMTIDSIRVHTRSGQHVVILKQKTAERYLPIWIGIFEAQAIAMRITGASPERPITHDLLANVLGAVDADIDRIVVTALDDEIFYARILATVDGRSMEIDSRPSDAIAVAVRVGAGIYVAGEVLERAGVVPEVEVESDAPQSEEEKKRAAKVRDWVNELNVPDLDQPRSDS